LVYNNGYQRDTLKEVFNMANAKDFKIGAKKVPFQVAQQVFSVKDALKESLSKFGMQLPTDLSGVNDFGPEQKRA
jgi:hypothetical protein